MASREERGKGELYTNKARPVYLLAGGSSKVRTGADPLIQIVFREIGKALPAVAYVGTASEDSRILFYRFSHILRAAGAGKVEHALIASNKADLKRARSILEAADIVFVGGGDVETGIRILEEKHMAGLLAGLHRKGKLFCGSSAGSIMLAKEWVRWRDPRDDSTAELFPCLGIAPIICDTHGEEDDWEELKTVLRIEKDGVSGYGIPSGTGIKVYPEGNVEVLGGAVHRYIRRGDSVDRDDLLKM